jgi:hypothetical protein
VLLQAPRSTPAVHSQYGLQHARRRLEARSEVLDTEIAEVEAGLLKLVSTLQAASWFEAGISGAVLKRLQDLDTLGKERQECKEELAGMNGNSAVQCMDQVLQIVEVRKPFEPHSAICDPSGSVEGGT